MEERKTDYYIFRLSFESYLKEMSAQLSLETLEKIRNYVLEHLLDITFKDGNGESTTAFGSTIFGQMGYVTIERRTNQVLDKPKCKDQTIMDTFPDFNLVVDGRHLEECNSIILAIEYRRKCFVNIDTARKGLERYFNLSVGTEFAAYACLSQVSSSDKFLLQLDKKVSCGIGLAAVHLEVKPQDGSEMIVGMDPEKAAMFSGLMNLLMNMEGDSGSLAIKAAKDKELNLERSRYHLGMVVDMACKYGFVVKAKLKDGSCVQSDRVAPLRFALDRNVVLKPDANDANHDAISKRQFEELTRWLDKIYEELEKIERKKKDEETRCITER